MFKIKFRRFFQIVFSFILLELLVVMVTSCANLSWKKSPFVIVANKKPVASIMLGKDAGEREEFAASELQKYVKRISGAELEIKKISSGESVKNAILIGTKRTNSLLAKYTEDSAKLGPEAFSIRVSEGNLIIAGGGGVGVLYGVYELLEHFGCRWFFPAKQWEVIPSLATLTVDASIHIIEEPSFKSRETWQGFGLRHLDWLAKNRCNYLVIPWYRFSERDYENAKEEIRKRGITIEIGHDNIINFWLPPKRYFKTHPEYYCLIDGKRKLVPFSKRSIGSQFCFSNREAAKEVAVNMCEFLDEHPEIKNIGLGISDAKPKDSMCQCENCRKLFSQYMDKNSSNYTGGFIYFANNVAELVAKRHPEAIITVGAYEYPSVFEAPCNIKAAPNLRLIIYLFLRDGSKALDFSGSKRNNFIMSEIKKWEKVFDPQNIVIGDYYYGMSGYRGGIWPIFEVIPQDFKCFHENRFHGVSLASGYQFAGRLNTWLFYKYAWNCDENIDILLDDFCAKFFDGAAKPMRRYISILSRMLQNYERSKIRNVPYASTPHLGSGDFLPAFSNILAMFDEKGLQSLDNCIKEARRKAPKEGIIAKRLEQVDYELDRSAFYVRMDVILQKTSKSLREAKYEEAIKALSVAEKLRKRAEKSYKNFSKDFQIPDIQAIYRTIEATKKRSERNLVNTQPGKNMRQGKIESVYKGGKITTVNWPTGWNCYRGEGSGSWGTCNDVSGNRKGCVFLEASGVYEWPDGKQTVNIGITPSGSDGYNADGAFEVKKNAGSRKYGFSFMGRIVGNPSVEIFVWGWDHAGKRKFIPVRFLNPVILDAKYSQFSGAFSLPDCIVKFTPVFRLASLGRLEISDVALFHLKPVLGIYMPAGDVSLTYGLAPIVDVLLKADLFNIVLITDLSAESLEKCQSLLIPMMQSAAMKDLCNERKQLRKYVQDGGNVFILRSACGYKPHGWPLGTTIFPEICKGVLAKAGARGDDDGKKLTVVKNDLIRFGCKNGVRAYWDHYVLIKGDAGNTIVVDNHKKPVVVAGRFGKGKVVFDGLAPFDDKTESEVMNGFEEEILLNSLKWFILSTDRKISK